MRRFIRPTLFLSSLLSALSLAPLGAAQERTKPDDSRVVDGAPPREGPRIMVNLRWDSRLSDLRSVLPRFANGKTFQEGRMKVAVYPKASNITSSSASIVVGSALQGGVDEAAIREAHEQYVQLLTDALHGEFDAHVKAQTARRERARMEVDKAKNEAARMDDEIRSFRQKLRQVSGRVDVSPKGIAAAATGLEEEAQRIAIETAAQEARKRALEEAIAVLAARGQALAKDDPVAAELTKIYEARRREAQLIEKLKEEGRISAAEAMDVQTKVAEARIRLLERQETLTRGVGADHLKQLNGELLTLSINLAEQQARHQAVAKALQRFADASEMLDQVDRIDQLRQEIYQVLDQNRMRLREVEKDTADLRPPTVSVQPAVSQ